MHFKLIILLAMGGTLLFVALIFQQNNKENQDQQENNSFNISLVALGNRYFQEGKFNQAEEAFLDELQNLGVVDREIHSAVGPHGTFAPSVHTNHVVF